MYLISEKLFPGFLLNNVLSQKIPTTKKKDITRPKTYVLIDFSEKWGLYVKWVGRAVVGVVFSPVQKHTLPRRG